MPKKNIIYKISNFYEGKLITDEEDTVPAIIEDDSIKYMVEGTTTIYNLKTNTLTRENRSLKIIMPFIKNEETESLITAKEINKTISMKLKTKELIQEDNNVRVEYESEGITFKYSIEVIE